MLVDRCLSPAVATALDRFDLIVARPLEQVYSGAERVPDVDFLSRAGDEGWCVLTQNFTMYMVQSERDVIRGHDTKVFSFASAQLLTTSQCLIVGKNLASIARRSRKPGACFWRIKEGDPTRDLA